MPNCWFVVTRRRWESSIDTYTVCIWIQLFVHLSFIHSIRDHTWRERGRFYNTLRTEFKGLLMCVWYFSNNSQHTQFNLLHYTVHVQCILVQHYVWYTTIISGAYCRICNRVSIIFKNFFFWRCTNSGLGFVYIITLLGFHHQRAF